MLQLAEYKINNSNETNIKYFKLKDLILSCIKDTPSSIYVPDTIYPLSEEKNIFIIYSLIPLRITNMLTNTIFEVYNKYVSMSTLLVDKEFTINIDNETLIYVILFVPLLPLKQYALPNSLIKSMKFKKLYTISEYIKLDQDAMQLYFKRCIKDLKIGGAYDKNKDSSPLIKSSILKEIYEKIKNSKEIKENILFLSYVNELLLGEDINFNNTMNVITLNEIVQHELIQLFVNILRKDPNYKLKIKDHKQFYIPNDFRLRKTNIYLEYKSKKIEKIYLCNIYNEGTYNVLPCIERFDILVPSKLVLLRYLYLDLFFIEKNPIFRQRIREVIQDIIEKFKDSDGIVLWKGIYKNERSDKIITNLNCNKDLTIYRPWEYFELHKKLRNIS